MPKMNIVMSLSDQWDDSRPALSGCYGNTIYLLSKKDLKEYPPQQYGRLLVMWSETKAILIARHQLI